MSKSEFATEPLSTSKIILKEYGEATVMECITESLPPLKPEEVRIRQTAIGVNYVDVYHRMGIYPLPEFPFGLGVEASGVIEAIGSDVASLHVGQRVAYTGSIGGYASVRNLPANKAILLPDDVEDDAIASLLLRGVTAHMLLNYVYPLKSDDTILIQAAAGGLGLILTQWAKGMGLKVIGTVSSDEKSALATANGLDHVIVYCEEDVVSRVKKLTNGKGVDYAIDGIGGDTLMDTLDCVRPYGMVANVGQVGGTLEHFDLSRLSATSVALSRLSVMRFMMDEDLYKEGVFETIKQLQKGLRPNIDTIMPLNNAVEAHRRLENGEVRGSILLRP